MTKTKDPDAKLDYVWDWAPWLTDTETITTVVWIVPTGIVQESATHTGTAATIWLSGGTAGQTYTVTCRITSSAGRIDDRSERIRVQER